MEGTWLLVPACDAERFARRSGQKAYNTAAVDEAFPMFYCLDVCQVSKLMDGDVERQNDDHELFTDRQVLDGALKIAVPSHSGKQLQYDKYR